MSRVDLGNGSWAELRDPTKLTERQRRPILQAMMRLPDEVVTKLTANGNTPSGLGLSADEAALLYTINDALAVGVTEAWSFTQPVSLDALLDLPSEAYDKLLAATAPVFSQLVVATAPSPEAESPTTPSSV